MASALPALLDVPLAPTALPALNALSQPPTTRMDHAAAQLDTTSLLVPSGSALNALNTPSPAPQPSLQLPASPTSTLSMEFVSAPMEDSSTPTDSVSPAQVDA